MKILFIVPGSGDSFYCGNCFRDNLQARALRKAGYDVMIMPLYLPFKYEAFVSDTPLFFPATSFYAGEKFFKKGKMPKWIANMLESKFMLAIASKFSGTTSAAGLEDITLSMITGNNAVFAQQVDPMLEWVEHHEKPDVIHLSSTLLIGVAKAIKNRVNIPIICSLQDEEVWINSLQGKYLQQAWQGIADNVQYVDKFVTTSEFYKKIAATQIEQIEDVDVIYPGVDVSTYKSDDYPADPTIGFFYRMNQENGLDILAQAFVKLKKRATIKNLKLKIAGGYTAKNKRFLNKVKKILKPYISDVEIYHTYNPDFHADFYKQISLICVPITFDEGVGLYLCEAFAAARPAVEPHTGSFAEIIGNAGLTYSPNDSDALAQALEKLLIDKDLFDKCCKEAAKMSQARYNDKTMAENLIKVYDNQIEKRKLS